MVFGGLLEIRLLFYVHYLLFCFEREGEREGESILNKVSNLPSHISPPTTVLYPATATEKVKTVDKFSEKIKSKNS